MDEDLVLALGADLSDLTAKLSDGARQVEQFVAHVQGIARALPQNLPVGQALASGLTEGLQGALHSVEQFTRETETRLRDVREAAQSLSLGDALFDRPLDVSALGLDQLRTGLTEAQEDLRNFGTETAAALSNLPIIDAARLAREADAAGRAYVESLTAQIQSLDAQALLPRGLATQLTQQLQTVGTEGAAAVRDALAQVAQVRGPQALTELSETVRQVSNDLRLGAGDVTQYRATLEAVTQTLTELRAAGFQPTGQEAQHLSALLGQLASAQRALEAAAPLEAQAAALSRVGETVRTATADYQLSRTTLEQYRATLTAAQADLAALRGAGFAPTGAALQEFTTLVARTQRELAALGAGGGATAIAEIADRVRALKADFQANLVTVEQYQRALAAARAEAIALREAGAISGGREIQQFNQVLGQTAASEAASRQAMQSLRSGARQVAIQMIGATGSVGQFAQGLLLLSGSGGLILPLAGIAAAIGLALHKMGEEAREARKKTEEMEQQLDHLREAARDPVTVAIEVSTNAQAEVTRLTTEIANLERARHIDLTAAAPEDLADALVALVRLPGLYKAADRAAQNASAANAHVGETAEEAADRVATALRTEAQDLASLVALGRVRAGDQARLNQLVAQFNALRGQEPARRPGETDEQLRQRFAHQRSEAEAALKAIHDAAEVPIRLRDEAFQRQLRGLAGQMRAATQGVEVAVRLQTDVNPIVRAVQTALGVPIPLTFDTSEVVGRARRVAEAARREIEQLGGVGQAPATLVEPYRALVGELGRIGTVEREQLTRLQDGLISASEQARARLAAVEAAPVDVFGGVLEKVVAVAQATQDVLAAERAVNAAVQAGLGTQEQRTRLLQEAAEAARAAVPPPQQRDALAADFPGTIRDLDDAAQRYAQAQDDFDTAVAEGDLAGERSAGKHRQAILDQIGAMEQAIRASDEFKHLAPTEQAAVMAAFANHAGRAARDLDHARTAAERLANAMRDVVDAAGAIGDLVDALGMGNEKTQQLIQGAQQVAANLPRALSGDPIAIIGAVSGAVKALNGIFGQGEAARMREQVERENTRALDDLRAEIRHFGDSVGDLAKAQDALRSIPADQLRALQGVSATFPDLGRNALDQILRQTGLTFAELNRVAQANGIQLLDEKGRLVASSFGALDEAIQLAVEDMTHWGRSFQEQADRFTLETKLFHPDAANDAMSRFQDEIRALTEVAPELGHLFDGLDLASQEGRDAARRLLQTLFSQFDEGFFAAHPELFGGLSKDDFLKFLGDGADALNGLAGAADNAAGEMLAVPTGFKIAAARFHAEIAGFTRDLEQRISGPVGDPTRIGPRQEPAPPTDTRVRDKDVPGSQDAEDAAKDVAASQAALLDQLKHIASTTPDDLLGRMDSLIFAVKGLHDSGLSDRRVPPSDGSDGGYRRRVPGASVASRPAVQLNLGPGAVVLHVPATTGPLDGTRLARQLHEGLMTLALGQTGDTLDVPLLS